MEFILVPTLTFIITLAGIYFDFHGSKGKKKWGLSAFILLVLFCIFCFDVEQRISNKNEKNELQKYNSNLNKEIDSLKKMSKNSQDPGVVKATIEEIQDRRNKITIFYYQKDQDIEPNFTKSLQTLKEDGYWFKEVISKRCDDECRSPTNAILFGSNLTDNDVKIIALSLIRDGLNSIKIVKQFKDPDYRKNDIILTYSSEAIYCTTVWEKSLFALDNTEVDFSRTRTVKNVKERGCRS